MEKLIAIFTSTSYVGIIIDRIRLLTSFPPSYIFFMLFDMMLL